MATQTDQRERGTCCGGRHLRSVRHVRRDLLLPEVGVASITITFTIIAAAITITNALVVISLIVTAVIGIVVAHIVVVVIVAIVAVVPIALATFVVVDVVVVIVTIVVVAGAKMISATRLIFYIRTLYLHKSTWLRPYSMKAASIAMEDAGLDRYRKMK